MKILLRNKKTKNRTIYDTNKTDLFDCKIIGTSVGLYFLDVPDDYGFSDISQITKIKFSDYDACEVIGYEYVGGFVKVLHGRHKKNKNKYVFTEHKPDLSKYKIWIKRYDCTWKVVGES